MWSNILWDASKNIQLHPSNPKSKIIQDEIFMSSVKASHRLCVIVDSQKLTLKFETRSTYWTTSTSLLCFIFKHISHHLRPERSVMFRNKELITFIPPEWSTVYMNSTYLCLVFDSPHLWRGILVPKLQHLRPQRIINVLFLLLLSYTENIEPLSDKLFQNFQLFHRLSTIFRQPLVVFSQGQQPFGIHASAFVILFALPCRLNLMVNCCVLNASLSGGQEGGDAWLRVI